MTHFLLLPLFIGGAIINGEDLNEGASFITVSSANINVIDYYIKDIEIEYSLSNGLTALDDRIISIDSSDYNIRINDTNSYIELYVYVDSNSELNIDLTLSNGEEQVFNNTIYENGIDGFPFNNAYYSDFNLTINTYDYYYIYSLGYDEGYDEGYDYGYDEGYGYGYDIGLEDNEEPFSVFRFLERVTATIANLLNTQIFPNITIGTILFIPIILKVVEFIVGWFR